MKNILLLMVSGFYMAALVYSQSIDRLSFEALLFFITCNVLGFIFYGMDKLAAVKGWHRSRERHFYVLALCGGWPGSVLGQIVFHHKTKKTRFRRWFYFMMVTNVLTMGWYSYLF